MPRVSKVLTKVVTRLTPLSDSPKLDAQVLRAEILGKARSWLTAHPDTPLTKSQIATTQEALSRLEAGQALPHVLGHWEFFGLDFDLDSVRHALADFRHIGLHTVHELAIRDDGRRVALGHDARRVLPRRCVAHRPAALGVVRG